MKINLNMMCNEYCRLCSSNNNVVNIFSNELINSDKLEKYIFTCSGVKILSDDIITKHVCHTCLETIRKLMKFRKDSINNDLNLKYILLGENNINERKMNDTDIDDVFNFLPSLEKESEIKEENVNENSDLNVDSVNLDLTDNNNSKVNMPINSFDINTVKTCKMEESQETEDIEINTNEFEDSIVKEETVVTAVCLPEDVELGINEEEMLKKEFISNDEEDCLNKLNEETLNKKEEGNKLTKRENKIKNMISKEVVIVLEGCLLKKNELKIQISNKNKINSRSDEKSFVKKGKFIDSDKKKPYKCSECGKLFRALQTFKVHRRLHSDIKQHQCPKCKRQFTRKDILDKHMFSHSDAKSFECLDCGKCFRIKRNLNEHRHIHSSTKSFVCSDCGKCFRFKSGFREHRRIHSGEKPYECSECGKKFSLKSNLIKHLSVHSDARPYECPDCGKCFRQKHDLTKHRHIHSNEKPYECSECGKKFTQKTHLIRHLNIHSGARPYKCPECGKCFRQKSNLPVHRRIHSNEKPYECSECGKKFNHKSNLNRHLDVHSSAGSGSSTPDL